MKGLRVWCLGNVLLGDDAAGCRVAEYLAERDMDGVVDCGTVPENYIATLRRDPPRTLLIVDAADMKLAGGDFRILDINALDATAISSHGIALPLLLEPFACEIEMVALGIQPMTLNPGSPLSTEVEAAAEAVADLIFKDAWRDIPGFP